MAFISQDDLYDRVKALAKIPNIKFTLKTCGNFDFRISVMIRDIKIVDLHTRGNRHMPGVTNMEISIKNPFSVWPLPREFTSIF